MYNFVDFIQTDTFPRHRWWYSNACTTSLRILSIRFYHGCSS